MRGSLIFHIIIFVVGLVIAVLLFGVFFKVPVAVALSSLAGMDPTRLQEETATLFTVAAYIPGDVNWGISVSAAHDIIFSCDPPPSPGLPCSSVAKIWLNVTPATTKPFTPPGSKSTLSTPSDILVYPKLISLWQLSDATSGTPAAMPGYLMVRKTGKAMTLEFERVSVKV
jgi:hypothetical protein